MMPWVTLTSPPVRRDDRGWLVELSRQGDPATSNPFGFGQNTLTLAHPGVIKAFHWHQRQWDHWTFVGGEAQVVLYDLRVKSESHQDTQVFYMTGSRPEILTIPPGVAHGYRVLGNQPALLLYMTSAPYDAAAPDELRIPYDDPTIGFDWETRPR